MTIHQLWFVRHQGKVLGQFPLKEIRDGLNRGEIVAQDEISPDQANWLPLAQFPGLVKAEVAPPPPNEDLDEDARKWHEERAKAAIRWETSPSHLQPVQVNQPNPLLKWGAGLLALAAVAGLGVFLTWQWQEAGEAPPPKLTIAAPIPDCTMTPSPKVNWANCDKSGTLLHEAELSGANLSGAKLNSTDLSGSRLGGANLAGADLSYATLNNAQLVEAKLRGANLNFAELRGADLSAADLRDANLAEAQWEGAKLDGATWTDGRVCANGSVGQCQ